MDIDEESQEKLVNRIFPLNNKIFNGIQTPFGSKFSTKYDGSIIISLVQLCILSLLEDMEKPVSDKIDKSNEILDEMIIYIESNCASISGVQDLCDVFFFSRSYIQKLFNENLNISPKQYIINYKISQAKKMLKTGNYMIREVSNLLGFKDPHYFSNTFRKETGLSPREYVDSLLTDEDSLAEHPNVQPDK